MSMKYAGILRRALRAAGHQREERYNRRVLAVISDLHFEEEASDAIPAPGGGPGLVFVRNLPPEAFERFFDELARRAVRDHARRLHLVLAGDIMDLHRTALWFRPDGGGRRLRPYVAVDAVDDRLEARILEILEAVAAEPRVAGSLAAIRKLARGRYLDLGSGREKDFPVPVGLTYLPGNHDRLAAATPRIRRRVRELLGLGGGGAPFPHRVVAGAEETLIRHGQEYDRYNFSRDLGRARTWREPTPEDYGKPAFGDFVTVDIASRLPVLFREVHGDEKILARPPLARLYLRLLEFDDLRPQTALLEFLLASRTGEARARMWRRMEPVLQRLLDEIHDRPFFRRWLSRLEKRWRPDAIDAVQAVLDLELWKAGIPLKLVRSLVALRRSSPGGPEAEDVAAREPLLREGRVRFVAAGHTHRPRVSLLAQTGGIERYYLDTGTWRNRIPANRELTAFGRLKALTSLVIYGPDEDPGRGRPAPASLSFDYWTGFTQRWRLDAGSGDRG